MSRLLVSAANHANNGHVTQRIRRHKPALTAAAPSKLAKVAGLVYVSDAHPGIRRLRAGKGFAYVTRSGKLIRQQRQLTRIRSLAIPPAWTDVWICPDPRGHLQATGRDARGRKQYRYHPRWRTESDQTKYDRLVTFGKSLPRIRRRTARDLRLPGLPRDKVLATVVRLLQKTLIRVGNEEYARENGSFGLTTMRNQHVQVNGSALRFVFRGKGGIKHAVDLNDRRLARIVKRCRDLPGQELFEYIDDDGNCRSIGSVDVNDYLREITGQDFTAKDFRTWAGTVLAATALQTFEACGSVTQARRNVARAIESVALRLGNTRSICQKCYVHPAVIAAYVDGSLQETLGPRGNEGQPSRRRSLSAEEAAVLAFLRRRTRKASPTCAPRTKAS
jgi:DNA topoisomerase I